MQKRRAWALGAIGVAGLGLAAGLAAWMSQGRSPADAGPKAVAANLSPIARLARAVAGGDGKALASLHDQLTLRAKDRDRALTEPEAADWTASATALRDGFDRLGPMTRTSAVTMAGDILALFSAESLPANWLEVLGPVHDVLSLGLADASAEARAAALGQAARAWAWVPGRDLFTVERVRLIDFKRGLHAPVVACLKQPEPQVRGAAVQCLGTLPIDAEAAPALAALHDADVTVRLQVLAAFAGRRDLLTEEAMFPLLNDPNPDLAAVAERVLAGRGLDAEQVGLCKMMGHPKADVRASAVPFLLRRTDLDPVLGLLYLSRDDEETVRLKAVEALSGRPTAESKARLAEMAAADPSPAVRQAASKFAPADATAALPPLPGSPSLNPRAN